MTHKPKTRLYVDAPLQTGTHIAVSDSQAGLLRNTLRCKGGETVALFNGKDGEWSAEVQCTGKRDVTLVVQQRLATQTHTPDIWLVFAPVKNEKIDFLARRAVELGVSTLMPVLTQHTIVQRVNSERLQANAIEAAEQCGRMDIPEIREPRALHKCLGDWPKTRPLLYCDESGEAPPIRHVLADMQLGACAVLIGPEGGFSREERQMIRQLSFVRPMHLGPRILRAETAALAALTQVQTWLGDWDQPPHFQGS